MRNITLIVALLVSAVIITTACGGGGSKKTIDVGDGNKVSVSQKLPDSFPDDFPIYHGADLQGAVQGEQDGVKGVVATWTSGDGFDKVKAFYDDAFRNGKWTTKAQGSASGSSFWSVENSSTGKVGYVAINPGDKVTISGIVGDNPEKANASGSGGNGSGDWSAESSPDAGTADNTSVTTLPAAVDLPSGFPKDTVPVPGDARVTIANTIAAGGGQTFTVAFYSKQSVEELGRYYKSALEGKGYTQSVQTSDANGLYAAYSEHNDGTGNIVIVSVSDGDVKGYREATLQVTDQGAG